MNALKKKNSLTRENKIDWSRRCDVILAELPFLLLTQEDNMRLSSQGVRELQYKNHIVLKQTKYTRVSLLI